MSASARRTKGKRRSPVDVLRAAGSGKNLAEVGKKRASALRRSGAVEVVKGGRQHFEPKELKDFFTTLPKTSFWYAYFYIQYHYGCRLSEPALILDEDVDFERKVIRIRRLKKAGEDDGYREYVYPADDRVLHAVRVAQAWKRQKKLEDNPFLFASNRRRAEADIGAERLSQLRNLGGWQAVSRFTAHRMFQTVAKQCHVPEQLCHSHTLRNTRAPVLLACGATLEQVNALLGHGAMKMTQQYMDVAETMKGKVKDVTSMGLGL